MALFDIEIKPNQDRLTYEFYLQGIFIGESPGSSGMFSMKPHFLIPFHKVDEIFKTNGIEIKPVRYTSTIEMQEYFMSKKFKQNE